MSTSQRVPGKTVAPSETEKLFSALAALAASTEALLGATSGLKDEGIAEIRAQAGESLQVALDHTAGFQKRALARARAAGRATDAYVRDHRWQVLGTAALAGVVLGAWVGRDGGSEPS